MSQMGRIQTLARYRLMSRTSNRSLLMTIILLLPGCASDVQLPVGQLPLDPVTFFLGRSYGDAKLHKIFGTTAQVRVESIGRKQDGALVLDQTIREAHHPSRTRQWLIRKVGPNEYSGTLTDAAGPVQISVQGPRAYINYKMNGALVVRQQLALQSDGTTVLNRLDVFKFGIRVATLQETIRKPRLNR